jgi:predicted nucleic acid-binding protein
MAKKIILDTSALIDIFDKGNNIGLLENDCQISVVSIYEYVRYKKLKEETKISLENAFDTFNLSNPIILIASEIFDTLRTNGITVNENDVYIAATAMANKSILCTKDKDFSKIKKLFNQLEINFLN